jgi:hypothetical protein
MATDQTDAPPQASSPPPGGTYGRRFEVGLGLLLLSTAALKMAGLTAGVLTSDGWFARPEVQFAAVVWEWLLAAGLLWGGARHLVWLASVLTFGLFSGINLSLGLAGQSTCNCLGVLAVNPWAVLALDGVILLLLALARPALGGFRRPARVVGELRPAAGYAAAAVGLAVALAGGGWLAYGSPAAALAQLTGQVGEVSPRVVHLGDQEVGTLFTYPVEVVNYSSEPLPITGGSATCSCLTWQDLPVTVPPRGRLTIAIKTRFPRTTGRFQQQAHLYAVTGGQLHELPFSVVARVVETPPGRLE